MRTLEGIVQRGDESAGVSSRSADPELEPTLGAAEPRVDAPKRREQGLKGPRQTQVAARVRNAVAGPALGGPHRPRRGAGAKAVQPGDRAQPRFRLSSVEVNDDIATREHASVRPWGLALRAGNQRPLRPKSFYDPLVNRSEIDPTSFAIAAEALDMHGHDARGGDDGRP